MKNRHWMPAAALFLLVTPGCENKAAVTTKQLAELERKANEALQRQGELERELEDQKLAVERDAIGRERMRIEQDRVELARQQGEVAAAEAEALRQREADLASREGRLQQEQSDWVAKESELAGRGAELNDRDRELAGREAIPFEVTEAIAPVADYGMFYDSLSSYGSWFETSDYGYVWQPAAISDSNWRPYSRGRWVCSDRGWTWVSEEPFGWATYHYGRWALIRGRGWVWVPGTEWAPSWVSWRQSGSHIGWAPLPPETMAYRNHRWDSTVDDQFGIGTAWFNFVEFRHFGSPLHGHCLPVSRNGLFIQGTANVTHIHLVNRQVICGGPQYEKINNRLERPIPFYRLELEGGARSGSESGDMRSRIKGDRLMVPAPNMKAAWNEGLRPARVKERIDTLEVERKDALRPEIKDRFKKNREEGKRIARRSMEELGGAEAFQQVRLERLEENRRQFGKKSGLQALQRDPANTPDRTPSEPPTRLDRPANDQGGGVARPAKRTNPVREPSQLAAATPDPRQPDSEAPAVTPPAAVSQPTRETADPRPVAEKSRDPNAPRDQDLQDSPNRLDRDLRGNSQQPTRQMHQSRTQEDRDGTSGLKNQDVVVQPRKVEEGPRGLQMDALRKRQAEQERLRQQQETRRQVQQAAEAREAVRQKQVEQQQQQAHEARQQAIERQQRQRQQEAEQQRQQEDARRRQQQDRQRQQEQSRPREQEQIQRQQQKAREVETEKARNRESGRNR